MIEGFQAKRRLEGADNRTVNMDIGALRQVLRRFKQWRRLADDVKMLTESGGEPIGRVLTNEEQERLLKTAEDNPEWDHVWCAAQLAANTSMRGVEVKHVRRKDFDPDNWRARSSPAGALGPTFDTLRTLCAHAKPIVGPGVGANKTRGSDVGVAIRNGPLEYVWRRLRFITENANCVAIELVQARVGTCASVLKPARSPS